MDETTGAKPSLLCSLAVTKRTATTDVNVISFAGILSEAGKRSGGYQWFENCGEHECTSIYGNLFTICHHISLDKGDRPTN